MNPPWNTMETNPRVRCAFDNVSSPISWGAIQILLADFFRKGGRGYPPATQAATFLLLNGRWGIYPILVFLSILKHKFLQKNIFVWVKFS